MTGIPSQPVPIPLLGGLSEKEDAILTRSPTELVNVRVDKTGTYSRRLGFRALAGFNTRMMVPVSPPSQNPPTPELLVSYQDELVRIGGGQLDAYRPLGNNPWFYRDRVPEAVVEVSKHAALEPSYAQFADPDIAYASTPNMIALVYVIQATGAYAYQIVCDVIDGTSGAYLLSKYVVASGSSTLVRPRARFNTTDGRLVISWFDYSATTLRARFLNYSTLAWSSAFTIANDVTGPFDVAPMTGSSSYVAVYEDALAGEIVAIAFDNTGSVVISETITSTGTHLVVDDLGIRHTADRLWIAWGNTTGGNSYARIATADASSLVLEAGPQALATRASGNRTRHVSIEQLSANRCIAAWHMEDDRQLVWNEATRSGSSLTAVYSPNRFLAYAVPISSVFVRNSRAYVWATNRPEDNIAPQLETRIPRSHFLLDLYAQETIPTECSARWVATTLVRQSDGLAPVRSTGVAAVCPVGSDTFLSITRTGFSDSKVLGLTYASDLVLTRTYFDTMRPRTAAVFGDVLLLSGGNVSVYDGVQACGLGFAHEPDPRAALRSAWSVGGSGAMDDSSTYAYRFSYKRIDARGRVYRSPPSPIIVAPTTGAGTGVNDRSVSLYVPCLHITDTMDVSTGASPVEIEIWRTECVGGVAGSTFYFVGSVRNIINSGLIAVTDGTSDANLTVREQAPWTGDVLDHVVPSSAQIVRVWKNAPILGGTDDDSIWIGGAGLPGEGPWVNDSLVIDPFEGGRVKAIEPLEAALVIFKSNSIYIITGEPPNDLGASQLSPPQRLQTDVGCDDPQSVVQTDQGIFFYSSQAGLCLLDRGFNVQRLGMAVTGSYPTPTNGRYFAGAVLDPTQHCVRWIHYRGHTALRYDYHHSAVYQTPVWTKEALQDPNNNDTTASVAACVMHGGRFHYITSDTGHLYREQLPTDVLAYLDLDWTGGLISLWIPTTITLAAQKPAGVQGWERLRRIQAAFAHTDGSSVPAVTMTLTTETGSISRTWTTSEISALSSGGRVQLEFHNSIQKCQWFKLSIVEVTPSNGFAGSGAGLALRDVTADVAILKARARIPAVARR